MGWTEISSHSQSTIMDEWAESLCIRSAQQEGGWELGICTLDDEGSLVTITDDASVHFDIPTAAAITRAIQALGWSQKVDTSDILGLLASLTNSSR